MARLFPALLGFLAITTAIGRADHYEVYLLAGQSNAGGHGYVSREFSQFSPNGDDGLVELGKSRYLEPQPDTLFLHWRGGNPTAAKPVLWDARTNGWIPLKAGYSMHGYNGSQPDQPGAETVNHPFGAEITFAERIRQGRPGRKVAVIKYSQGNTTLGTVAAPGAWDPATGRSYQAGSLANAGHCYRGLLDLVNLGLGELTRRGHTFELRGLVWHQGESDSGLSATVYKDRLKEFIAAIRSDLGKPELPVIIGELIQSGYATTRGAQRLAAAETPRAAFVSSVGLKGDSTTIHFDTTGQLELGRRYAERMLQLSTPMRRSIAHWRLDETSLAWNATLTPVTDSISGTEGVLYGYTEADVNTVNRSVVNQPGPTGGSDRAIDFAHDAGISGVNTNRPDALPASSDLTLLVWMKTSDPHPSQGHLFSNNNGQTGRASLHVTAGSLTWFHHGGVTLTETNSPVFDGAWHRVGVTRRGNSWSLLRDGNVVATGTSAGTISQDTEWMIGRMRSFNGNFEGSIGEVLVLNHALPTPLGIQSFRFMPGGTCQLAWNTEQGFEDGLEWSDDLVRWNLLDILPANSASRTHSFADPGNGRRLFVRVR
jgi:Carbohydrate esterase, sialic acid-specific acetylesterase/Concanavalin A-like lectin/glucanases superfamily